MKKVLCGLFSLALLLFSSACADAGAPATAQAEDQLDTRLRVVTTIFPPYDFVRELGAEHVNLTLLVPPGSESHSFEPSPQDIIAIMESDLFIYIGGDSDDWVERILGSLDTADLQTLAFLEIVEAQEERIVAGMQHDHAPDDEDGHDHDNEGEHGHDHEHDEVELDEHVWTSPQNAIEIVHALAATLSELDPEHAAAYQANAERYTAELAELDAEFAAIVVEAARHTLIFADRFPLRYFADAYGLDYFAAFPGCSTETEASAATVAFLIDKVIEEEIPIVFFIEFSNERMADVICESTGSQKLLFHSCHNVSRDDLRAGVTYLQLMRQNAVNLKEALY